MHFVHLWMLVHQNLQNIQSLPVQLLLQQLLYLHDLSLHICIHLLFNPYNNHTSQFKIYQWYIHFKPPSFSPCFSPSPRQWISLQTAHLPNSTKQQPCPVPHAKQTQPQPPTAPSATAPPPPTLTQLPQECACPYPPPQYVCLTQGPRNGQALTIYDERGNLLTTPTLLPCKGTLSNDGFHCIPCPTNALFTNGSCKCTNGYLINSLCYASTRSLTSPTDINNIVGCQDLQLTQPCQQMINTCVDSKYSPNDASCTLFSTLSNTTHLPKFTLTAGESLNIEASADYNINTTTVQSQLQFILFQYHANGTLNKIKPFDQYILPCPLSQSQTITFLSFGLTFSMSCPTARVLPKMYYDLYVVNAAGQYVQVPILMNSVLRKRFTTNLFNSAQMIYSTLPPMQVPILSLFDSPLPSISTTASQSSFPFNTLIALAVIMVLTIIVFILHFYSYLSYNPNENNDPYYCCKVILYLAVYIVKYLGVGLWLFLLTYGTFILAFYKFQQSTFLLLPTASSLLFDPYMAVFYADIAIVFLALIIVIIHMTLYVDFFLIDWEKEKVTGLLVKSKQEVSVWRKVLLVNQLYELAIKRTIKVQVIAFFTTMLLDGANWISLATNAPYARLQTNPTTNPMLAFILLTLLITAVAAVQLALRYILRIWLPFPSDNFIDLCSLTNISLIIFDEALHGYYIHGVNPVGQSEGSLTHIDSIFEKEAKSFGKSRSFSLEDADHTQSFEVIFPLRIREAFQVRYKSNYLRKLTEKNYDNSILAKAVPDALTEQDYRELEEISATMLESFKYYLEGVKAAPMNVRDPTLTERLIKCPVEAGGHLPIFLKDPWNGFENVMLCGHQWILVINFSNFVNIFYLLTKSVWISFLLALLLDKFVVTLFAQFMIKRNISKNTLIDDKFFS